MKIYVNGKLTEKWWERRGTPVGPLRVNAAWRGKKLAEAEEIATQVSIMSTENQPAFVREQGLLALANGRFDEATAQLTEAVKLAQRADDAPARSRPSRRR